MFLTARDSKPDINNDLAASRRELLERSEEKGEKKFAS